MTPLAALSQASGKVSAYDPKDGSEIWKVRYGERYSLVPRPIYADGLIYVTTGFDRPLMIGVFEHGVRPRGWRGEPHSIRCMSPLPMGAIQEVDLQGSPSCTPPQQGLSRSLNDPEEMGRSVGLQALPASRDLKKSRGSRTRSWQCADRSNGNLSVLELCHVSRSGY